MQGKNIMPVTLDRPRSIIEQAKAPVQPKVEVRKPTPASADSDEGRARRRITDEKAAAIHPDAIIKELAGVPEARVGEVGLKVDLSSENLARLAALRNPENVGPDKYGDSLVNVNHKGKKTVAEHEEAQEAAYTGLQEKIDKGLVDPAQIGSEMVRELGVSPDVVDPPQTHAEIPGRVGTELQTFVEQGFITSEESAVIQQEVETFNRIYHEAYPEADAAKAYELVRDNARKLTYQTKRDKQVFSGSDHGIKHILQGNMNFADQMITSLEAQGLDVSAKDNILIRQIITDHDCGYTCGCGQAKKGFEASKDHPVFSAKFVEANKGYYTDKFGTEGYDVIQSSILNHSYPTALPQTFVEGEIHTDLVRSISSTVDSLGVTAETKTPLFFTTPEAVRPLLKLRLAMEILPKGSEDYKKVFQNVVAELKTAAVLEQNPDRQAGYLRSIDNFFNEFTAETTLGHYTGVVDSVSVVRKADGKLVPQVDMQMSRIHALLGNMFGGKAEGQAFRKAMEDFGMDEANLTMFASTLLEARRTGIPPTPDKLVHDSPTARFVLKPQLAENAPDAFPGIAPVMDEVYALSVRSEINSLLDQMKDGDVALLPKVQARFERGVSSKTTAEEFRELNALLINLSDVSPSGNVDAAGKPLTVADSAKVRLKGFLTTQEKAFLGVS